MPTFHEWLASAARGDQHVYARGYLAQMRHSRTVALHADEPVEEAITVACDAAHDAWDAYERGRVLLTQRRHGAFDYSYIATRI